MQKNKFAQVADTATWVVATIVIIFILMISVYAASKIGRTAGVFSGNEKNQEFLTQQSFQAYLLTKNSNGIAFYNQISSSGKIDSADELIAKALFGKIYGISDDEISLRITGEKSGPFANPPPQYANIDKNNFIELAIKSEPLERQFEK